MLEYDFLKMIYDPIRIYRDFPLPAIICDLDFAAHWSNPIAKAQYAGLARQEGVREVLEEFGLEAVRGELEATGNYTVRMVFPPEDLCMSLSPIFYEGKMVGITALCLPQDMPLGGQAHTRASSAPQTLARSIRGAVAEMFEALDVVASKADMMKMGWIRPGLSRVGIKSYGILRIAMNVSEYARYRQENPQEFLRLEVVNLSALFEELKAETQELCNAAKIPICFECESRNIHVQLDVGQFEIAFYNLLHNSISYTVPGNEIRVRISRSGRAALLEVEDRGLGIPQSELEHVRRPYVTYRRQSGEGAGLGLPLASLIAQAHGGCLNLTSKPGEGTVASISLPAIGFSQQLPLGTGKGRGGGGGRFSAAYVGLADAAFRDPVN